MGANAQTTVPTFTAGQVLTAAQQNASARTGVPVFASTVTRDAGFGGSGEKTLAEGQLCYVEGTGLQTYNGTAWVTWGAAPTASGLTLISSTTIGNAVSTITVSNAFSSTYDNYRITINGGATTSNVHLRLALGSTATGYYNFSVYGQYNSSTVSGSNQSNGAHWIFAGRGTTNTIQMQVDLQSPNLAKNTIYSSTSIGAATTDFNLWVGGYLADTTQYTAFTVSQDGAATFTGGTIRVYGYQNS